MKESVYRTRGDRVNKTNMHEKNTDLPTTMFENSVMKWVGAETTKFGISNYILIYKIMNWK